jgi:hypothetical protein
LNKQKGAMLAREVMQLCRLGKAPHEWFGFRVAEKAVPISFLTAMYLDLSALRGSKRAVIDRYRKAHEYDVREKTGGVNSMLTLAEINAGLEDG